MKVLMLVLFSWYPNDHSLLETVPLDPEVTMQECLEWGEEIQLDMLHEDMFGELRVTYACVEQ